MVRTLVVQAQLHDEMSREPISRLVLLWQAMISPPLLVTCEITTPQRASAAVKLEEIKYDEFDEGVAHQILEHHERLLEVGYN